ncbi:heterodisulfide reductase subunit F [Candidatus Desantisbacteria bacterium CG_4_10_14_0_8_um_filter_48_22]|uniref:Heterodisulfide reductase subunit F n=1 Tax=Candidatus Desantisbacteria bacterium CG_4_10_14_0_8_um_filter_48_22 TaxID=1974543 RepID=A0A2M7S8S8_9BACT|nr:MAG: heterodisulfide reductase subunit F [Candidatus Desantisbacteria bacterium CG02_land_8_20_14_3_00_49_13]PIZ15879.1 MAG: heterodisulfide reductase subunit F [Candidatus Desantisbacteria bacterium CG_4_10_14_0_8_um_filter_48_22]
MHENIYLPNLCKIEKITDETPDVKTFKLAFLDESVRNNFTYKPGQFVELSVLGEGEAPFCLASSPTRRGFIECSIKKMGKATQAIHDLLEEGDVVGIRGPYGNGFSVEEMKGNDLLFIAGGIGLAPLRSLLNTTLDNRTDFGKITIVNGARTPKDLVYKYEYETWQKAKNTSLHLTVDCADESWSCMVGVVPKALKEIKPCCDNAVAIICGPPIMIKFTLPVLIEMGFRPEDIVTTLERKMQCGFGKCGHCMVGGIYVCKDGPVFNYAQIEKFKEEF